MNQLNEVLKNATDQNGIKVNVGFKTEDLFLLGAVILIAVVVAGVLVKLITRNF